MLSLKIIVTDRQSIEAGIVVESEYVIISIHDPGKPPAKIPAQPGLRGVLVLSFHDTQPTAGIELPPNIQPITTEQAMAVWNFIDQHRAAVGAIVVHCEQGMSRSPAVAAAISEALGLDPRRFWQNYTPSSHLYHCLIDAFENRNSNAG